MLEAGDTVRRDPEPILTRSFVFSSIMGPPFTAFVYRTKKGREWLHIPVGAPNNIADVINGMPWITVDQTIQASVQGF